MQTERMADKGNMLSPAHILKPALDFVLPHRCPSCGTITPDGSAFCGNCWQRLHFLSPPWCSKCALPFSYDQGGDAACANCLAIPPLHDGIRAVVAYDDISRQVILRLKYGGKIGLAKVVARQLVRHLPDNRVGLLIAPVPLHWTRLWSRSFNQSALIATELARLGEIECIPDLLIRTKRTPSLRGFSGKERRRAVGAAFAIHPRWQGRVSGARIVLVDDVLTSGATSDGCFKTLKKNGAAWMQLFCWARAMRGETAMADRPVALDA
ncbi:MAG: double zinc ribbon domain-containing protein [Gammaproteobacteria bacterium]